MELEVCGVVFESDDVPKLFFPDYLFPADNIPDSLQDNIWSHIQDLRKVHKEDDAYKPLVAVLSCIVNPSRDSTDSQSDDSGDPTGSDDSAGTSVPLPSVFFIVYTKQMKHKFDGAGRLKPDGLGTDKAVAPEEAVPWCAVRIAIEVKGQWRTGLQQGLTYARSMLEVGDKWYSMVIVYNHKTMSLRFVFATRHAVFMTPAWSLSSPRTFALIASTLIRACNAVGSTAGFDLHKARDVEGNTHLVLPEMQHSIQLGDPLCRRIHIIGRWTHVYPASLSDSFVRAERDTLDDPPEFSQHLEDDATVRVPYLDIAGVAHPERTIVASPGSRSGHDAHTLPHQQTAISDQTVEPVAVEPDIVTNSEDGPAPAAVVPPARALSAPPVPPASSTTAASLYSKGTWESLCLQPQLHWEPEALDDIGSGELGVKETWVAEERLNIEVEVLQAVKGLPGFVEYAGHMTIPHPGMERLSAFSAPPPAGKSRRCPEWPQVYPDGEPRLRKRVHRVIFYKTVGDDLVIIGIFRIRIAHAMKDAATALLILYIKKYLHRDLSTWNLVVHKKPLKTSAEQLKVLKRLFGNKFSKISELFHEQHIFLIDFDHAVRWDAKREPLPGRSGTWAFMAAARLRAWVSKAPWVDSLIDDLESAVWSLFYAVLHANRKILSPIEKLHYESFNSDSPYALAATKHLILALEEGESGDLSALKGTWPLWWRLFRVARVARIAITAVKHRLSRGQTFADASEEVRKEMDQVYRSTVFNYVDAVREALEEMQA